MTRTLTALLASAAVALPLAGAPAASADDSAVQQRYVTSLVVAHRNAAAYTESADYARCLEYWAQHPDWDLGK